MTKMANTKLDDIIIDLEEWIESCLEPDNPLLPIGEGKMLSPRQFLEEIKNDTDLGKNIEVNLVKIVVELIKRVCQPSGICP